MVKVGNEAPARWRKPPANRNSPHPRQARLSSTLREIARCHANPASSVSIVFVGAILEQVNQEQV